MRTRRSWRNQDRLFKQLGKELARAAARGSDPDPIGTRAYFAQFLHSMTQHDACTYRYQRAQQACDDARRGRQAAR